MSTRHVSMRFDEDTIARLDRESHQRREPKSRVAERLIDEGLRMQQHGSIVFRDGPSGRRAGLAGSGLDVWEIVTTVSAHGGDVGSASEYLSLPAWIVTDAMRYYAEYRAEIDEWIAENERAARDLV